MDRWADQIVPLLQNLVKCDPVYQELIQYSAEKRKRYEEIVKRLSPEESEAVEDYIASCEDLEFRKAQLAFLLGQIL